MIQTLSHKDLSGAPYFFFISAVTHYSGGIITDDRLIGDIAMEFRVNGVDLPFEKTMLDMYERMEKNFSARVLARAQDLISAAALEPLRQALDDAEEQIETALRTALQKEKP
jgi:hypothetical protein